MVFDAHAKAGGLNEYGIAAYKVPDFAQREVDWLLSIGGIEVRPGQMLGRDFSLGSLRAEYDAVFLGIGLAGVNALGLEGESLQGVHNAVDFIAALRQAGNLAALPIGRRVVVIGGGNTAIDAAVQSRRLGAEQVTLVYRRGAEAMSATWAERCWRDLPHGAFVNDDPLLTWIADDGPAGVSACGLLLIAVLSLGATSGVKTYKPPFKLGPSGGDEFNYVSAEPDGSVTMSIEGVVT